jgi:hypothetical protein
VTAPWSAETAQHEAAGIAATFGLFECDACAAAIAQRLGKDFPAAFERLQTSDNSDIIGLAGADDQNSRNRTHVRVTVVGKFYENMHPD